MRSSQVPPRGGPRTAGGKARSRKNALTHGMTAKVLLPQILGADLVARCYERLCGEWQPRTPTETFFIREMARHEAALDRIEQIELAALRRSARASLDLGLHDMTQSGDIDLADIALAGAGTADAIERVSRYRRPHERAYIRSLNGLRELRGNAAPGSEPPKAVGEQPPAFNSENDCEAYLAARWTSAEVRCPCCGQDGGCWIASRKVWQCRSCRRQSTLRAGTVMHGSPLKLTVWFRAIRVLTMDPSAATAELAEATGLSRWATVRRLAQRIRDAITSTEASKLLAGLDQVFHPLGGC